MKVGSSVLARNLHPNGAQCIIVSSRHVNDFVYTLLLNVKWETLPAAAVGREINN